MQDVEKLGSKKGVVSQSIKEVLQVCHDGSSFLLLSRQIQKFRSPWFSNPKSRPGRKSDIARCCFPTEHANAKGDENPHTASAIAQSLVDDDLVHQERIGASNYFW